MGEEEKEEQEEQEEYLLLKKGEIRMSFLSSIKKVLNIGQTEKKRKLILQNIKVCMVFIKAHIRFNL